MKRLLFSASALLCPLTCEANRSDTFDYFTLSINKTTYENVDYTPSIALNDNQLLSSENEAVGGRLTLGHQFNRYFALEGGISIYGSADFSFSDADEANPSINGDLSQQSFDFRAIATLPIGRRIFFRFQVGAAMWQQTYEYVAVTETGFKLESTESNDVEPTYAFGIGIGVSRNFALSVELEQASFNDIDSIVTQVSFSFKI